MVETVDTTNNGRMNPVIKTEWIKALRSGDYIQGTQVLHILKIKTINSDTVPSYVVEHQYCCLGVLCELAIESNVIPEPTLIVSNNFRYGLGTLDNSSITFIPASITFIPDSVVSWAEMPNFDGRFSLRDVMPANIDLDDERSITTSISLARLNDEGFTFNQIADIIDYFF